MYAHWGFSLTVNAYNISPLRDEREGKFQKVYGYFTAINCLWGMMVM